MVLSIAVWLCLKITDMRTIKAIFKSFLALVSVCALAGSCVYDYEPKDARVQGLGKPLVVIDGDIIVGGITKVKVSLTEPLAEDAAVLPLGANVWVESGNGEVISGRVLVDEINCFEVNTEGLDMQGRYRLGVSIPGRGEYISRFGDVMVSPPIDDITWSISRDGTYVNVEVTTHNTEKEKLYCKWSYTENWESPAVIEPSAEYIPYKGNNGLRYLAPDEILERSKCWSEAVSTDVCIANTEKLSENLISKSVIKRIADTDTRAMALYAITVTQKALDQEAYRYWDALKRNTGSIGGIFSEQPTELRGNIVSATNPDEVVVGYISVTTSTNMRKFIDWEDVDLYKPGCSSVQFEGLWDAKYQQGYRVYAIDEGSPWWSYHRCVDCRVYSNSTRPDFWPVE